MLKDERGETYLCQIVNFSSNVSTSLYLHVCLLESVLMFECRGVETPYPICPNWNNFIQDK